MKTGSENIKFAIQYADNTLQKEILASMVSVRWGFILFTQTFAEREQLLCVWDFVLQDDFHVACIMAALLMTIRFPEEDDTMLRLSKTIDVVVTESETTSEIIALAHRLSTSKKKNTALAK